MTSRPLVLEDFDSARPAAAPPGALPANADHPTAAEVEEEKLKAYEKGYGAGWEDAAAAFEKEQGRIASDLGQHLQELSFTYHEAHAALQRDLAGVVQGLIAKVLAPSARHALGEMIEERIAELAAQTQAPVEVSVAPDNVARVEAVVAAANGPPLRVLPEPSLGSGQAFLRFGTAEEQIDLDAVLTEIADTVDRYFSAAAEAGAAGEEPTKEAQYG
ncbi:MAG: hypothetical protein AAGG09_15995 [Pseudomonadota bacterium]